MSKNVGASTSRNPEGLHFLCRDDFTFYTSDVKEILTFKPFKVEVRRLTSRNNFFPDSVGGKKLFLVGPKPFFDVIFTEVPSS
jgi:hypothetical protein